MALLVVPLLFSSSPPRKPVTVQEQMERALAVLGPTGNDVAKALKRQYVKGYLYNSWECPVARYLTKRLNTQVSVGPYKAYLLKDVTIEVNVPSGVSTFIKEFDNMKYPEMVDHHTVPLVIRS
jgi:hypothetical protein